MLPIEERGEIICMYKDSVSIKSSVMKNDQSLHWHKTFDFELITSGNCIEEVNGISYNCSPGTIMCHTPTDFHKITILEGQELRLISLSISPEILNDEMFELMAGKKIGPCCRLSNEENSKLINLLESVFDEITSKQMGVNIILNAIINQIFIFIMRLTQQGTYMTSDFEKRIKTSLCYVDYNFSRPISLADVAEKVHLAPSYFSKIFHEKTGFTYKNYMVNKRLDFAMKVIKATDLPIAQVCSECGFNSEPHFIRAFKKKYNNSPRYFRKKEKKAQN